MISEFTPERLACAGPADLSDALERGRIVYFPKCPIELPLPEDLVFLREETPKALKLKNVSYHPESDRVYGIQGGQAIKKRVHALLKEHGRRVQAFLRRVIPTLARDWEVGTSSFRPLEEHDRKLPAHASNELVHIDAGAYGATHGDRIIRFFVNVNPSEDRCWVSKGAFPELLARHGKTAGVVPEPRPLRFLEESAWDRLRTVLVDSLSRIVSSARFLDSSPYDRAMRKFHNFMKNTPAFQEDPEVHREFSFEPFSAWMVFTDMVSHACVSGRFAFVDTFIVPLRNCRLPEMAPINILKGHRNGGA